IETPAETFKRLPGQADDEVGVDVNAGVLAEKVEIVSQPLVILAAADEFGDARIESLDADFKLKRAGRKTGDDFAQRLGQAVGDHLEMHEKPGRIAVQKELQQRFAHAEIQVERAIHEFELPDGDIERRKTELARERAAAGSFHVNDPMRDIALVVQRIRRGQSCEIGDIGGDDFCGRTITGEQNAANLGEFQVGFAGDDVVRLLRDLLPVGFVAHLGPAEDDDDLGAQAFEDGDDLRGGGGIPDVNAEANDARVFREKLLDDFDGSLMNVEFEEGGAGPEFIEIGQEITQTEGGVNVFCVECGQDNVGHGAG